MTSYQIHLVTLGGYGLYHVSDDESNRWAIKKFADESHVSEHDTVSSALRAMADLLEEKEDAKP